MNNGSKQEYLSAIRSRYLAANKSEKKAILDEFCTVCGYNRKHAIRAVRHPSQTASSPQKLRRGRKTKYHQPALSFTRSQSVIAKFGSEAAATRI